MKIVFKISVFLVFFSFTSCFEIVEEVTLKKDGSGEMSFSINLSQSKTKLNSIMLMDSINGYKVPKKSDIDKAISKLTEHLKSTPGISNVKKSIDYKNFIFSISCSFSKIENINDIAIKAQQKYKIKDVDKSSLKGFTFDVNNKIFKRFYSYNPKAKKEFLKLDKENREVMNNANYTCIYRFSEPIISNKNIHSKLSKSKKAVLLKMSFLDLVNGTKKLNNTITLTP